MSSQPGTLVDLTRLPDLDDVTVDGSGAVIGALARMSRVAGDKAVRDGFPAVTESLLLAASAQLRNMATIGGNLLQRTRCAYFRDPAGFPACNKRAPGTGCSALDGLTRDHAVLGTSQSCIALYPGDLAVALTALDATVHTTQRSIPVEHLFVEPGTAPDRETVLEPAEIVTSVSIKASPMAANSTYLKVRDRQSYEFAAASAAVALGLEEDGATIRDIRVAARRRRHPAMARTRGRGRPSRPSAGRGDDPGRQPRHDGRRDRPRRQRLQDRTGPACRRAGHSSGWRNSMNLAQPPAKRGDASDGAAPSGPLGRSMVRADGPLKIAGKAVYALEHPVENLLHCVIVQSTQGAGRVRAIDRSAAEASPGVRLVLEAGNSPRLKAQADFFGNKPPGEDYTPFATEISHNGELIAAVVADTLEQAAGRRAAPASRHRASAGGRHPRRPARRTRPFRAPRQGLGRPGCRARERGGGDRGHLRDAPGIQRAHRAARADRPLGSGRPPCRLRAEPVGRRHGQSLRGLVRPALRERAGRIPLRRRRLRLQGPGPAPLRGGGHRGADAAAPRQACRHPPPDLYGLWWTSGDPAGPEARGDGGRRPAGDRSRRRE